MTGSNRRPHACKAYALPAELIAHMELPVRFELTTYALLVRCSGQLSYGSIYYLGRRSAPKFDLAEETGLEPARRCRRTVF